MRKTLMMAVAAAALFATGAAQADMVKLAATLSSSQEVPPNTGAGAGKMTGTLDTATKTLTYNITYTGLSGPATAAHIHGPAAVGVNAAVMLPFKTPASPITGTATVTDAVAQAILSGNAYVNVHTGANPGGEIRGQITKQ
jgi:CHRD domain